MKRAIRVFMAAALLGGMACGGEPESSLTKAVTAGQHEDKTKATKFSSPVAADGAAHAVKSTVTSGRKMEEVEVTPVDNEMSWTAPTKKTETTSAEFTGSVTPAEGADKSYFSKFSGKIEPLTGGGGGGGGEPPDMTFSFFGELEAVKVTFSAAPEPTGANATEKNMFGYDDYDTADDCSDDHVSVGKGKDTWVKVTVKGAKNADKIEFVPESEATVTVTKPADTPAAGFYLKITGGETTGETTINARLGSRTGPVCGKMKVNNYILKTHELIVYGVVDTTSAGTSPHPIINKEALKSHINKIAKQGVIEFNPVDFIPNKNLAYDVIKNDRLDFYFDGGENVEWIKFTKAALTGSATSTTKTGALVKTIYFSWRLATNAEAGQNKVTLIGGRVISAYKGHTFTLGGEEVKLQDVNGNEITLERNLVGRHLAGTALTIPDGGALSGDPFICPSNNLNTISHETLHFNGTLRDVKSPDNIMYYARSDAKHKLRHKPQEQYYEVGSKQNQWDALPR